MVQTAACQNTARQKDGDMKDGNMDKMEGCDGQGHITMKILHWHDVKGNCCDYLRDAHIKVSESER